MVLVLSTVALGLLSRGTADWGRPEDLMTLLGRANWYLPGGLQRVLPRVHVESDEEAAELPN